MCQPRVTATSLCNPSHSVDLTVLSHLFSSLCHVFCSLLNHHSPARMISATTSSWGSVVMPRTCSVRVDARGTDRQPAPSAFHHVDARQSFGRPEKYEAGVSRVGPRVCSRLMQPATRSHPRPRRRPSRQKSTGPSRFADMYNEHSCPSMP